MVKAAAQGSEEVDEDGLTATERAYLTTPFSELDQGQRQAAMAIRDKRDQHRWAENARQRELDEKKRKIIKHG